MGYKYRVYLDSGANIYSCYEQTIDTEEDLGISDEDWDSMSEKSKDEIMKDIAWERMEWGYHPVEESE